MTMVPAPKLSKPHLIFYGGCGAASPEVMSRFGDGCSSGGGGGGYNNINGNHHDATTTADNIITNKVDKSSINNNNNNKVISSVLGSDLGIGHPHHHHHNINIVMADEQQQQQQQQQHSRNSNNSVNDDDGDGSGGVIRQRSNSVAKTREDDDVMDSSSWLQLGLGGGGGTHLGSSSPHQVESTAPRTSGSGALMLELNLGGGFHHHRHNHNHNHNQTTPFQMPGLDSRVPQTPPHGSFGGGSVSGPTTFVSPHHQILISSLSPQSQLYLLHQQQQQQQQLQLQLQQQQLGWGLMNQRTTMSASMSPSSSSSLPPQQVLLPAAQSGIPPFFTRPFTSSGASVDAPDSEFRLIHPPPRRPHSGIWFSLHASLHQSKEPFLPQVSKNFLRIKDGRMTVRLVMKYLANKLGLDNESEVEIRCRGQQLVPFLTLQHVRDNIWSPREAAVTLLPDSSTSDHLMVLNYGRSTTSSAYNYLT